MNSYIVKIGYQEPSFINTPKKILCKNDDELTLLINHLDKKKYKIDNIEVIHLDNDIKEFCKKDKKLETGKKGEK